jgi:hypothetical protein
LLIKSQKASDYLSCLLAFYQKYFKRFYYH